MRRDKNAYPSKEFWDRYGHLVFVDTAGHVTLTRRGRSILGAAITAMGVPLNQPMPLEVFERTALKSEPYVQALRSDMALLNRLPPGSAERELLAQLLGIDDVSSTRRRCEVVDLARLRAHRSSPTSSLGISSLQA